MTRFIYKIFQKSEEITSRLSKKIPVLRTIIKKQFYLKSFVCAATVIVSFISFNAAFLIAFNIYQNILEKRSREVSNAVSEQVYSSMLQLMEKGWTRDELNRFLKSLKGADTKLPYNVELYRGETVEKTFGKVNQPEMDEDVRNVFSSGNILNTKSGYYLRDVYPIKADDKCLNCHLNAKKGEVLGVINIQQDMAPALTEAKKSFITLFFILSPIPFIMAFLMTNFINARIGISTELFYRKIKDINSISDLTKLEMEEIDSGFTEFNKILSESREFVKKMRNIAVDKDILEFEVKILEKFIITSEVVRDWKEYVEHLLLEVNKVMETYTMFSIFQVGEDLHNLEIFWRNKPSEDTKEKFERIIIHRILKENERFAGGMNVVHNIADSSKELDDLSEKDIELQTKTLVLGTPRIGGVVGIGVQSKIASDPVRSLAIDIVLSTLLNVVGSIKAISKYMQDLEFYATRDPLTNLYNQRVFWEMLGYETGRATRYGYKFSLIVIDLDNFKNINDSYGHVFGDKFMAEFAIKVRETLRQGDMLARYGGDEFVAVLPEADEGQAFQVASRVKQHVGGLSLLAPDGSRVRATVSIGLSVFPDHADNAEDLFIFADNMMYRAKSEGKDRIIIPTQKDIIEVFKTVSEKTLIITNALEQKKIIPYFQPIMNIQTGQMECHEVFSRIKTDKGILIAGEFIEIAEKLGAITRLDLILLEKAFEKVKNMGYSGYLFINLSPKSLILGEFIPSVLKLTREYDIDPHKIVFEITERDTVKNISLFEKFVDNLKFEGFKFAIDDFGAGFSSFHYIKRLPLDFVKIEGDFIRSMVSNKKDMAIVKTLLALAKGFNIKTIAEYVENQDILVSTNTLGIDYAQGYYVGMPSQELVIRNH